MGPKIVKLDGRFNGFPHFSHYINYNSGTVWQDTKEQLFMSNRHWFWLSFGPSCELRMHSRLIRSEDKNVVTDWCWETEFHHMRIYVTKEALSHYVLTFGA